jgi:hypothetical protein
MARLTLPLRFRDEASANSCIEGTGLFPIGARAIKGHLGRWFVVIDNARNAEAVLRHLQTKMPGIEWQVSP